jgi:hypothetical protein
MWAGGGTRFEDPEEAKREVEELVKEREELLRSSTALERLIGNQKQVRIHRVGESERARERESGRA